MPRRRRIGMLLGVLLLAGGIAAAPGPQTMPARVTRGPSSAPATRPSPPAPKAGQEEPSDKFDPPSAAEVQAAARLAADWGRQAAQMAPRMHPVETPHFLIYSAWDAAEDRPLAELCERLYQVMCGQFGMSPKENIWIYKLTVFVFWEEAPYQKFTADVCHAGALGAKSSGLQGREGPFSYLVLGPIRTKSWFYEVLVHESSHAFLSRYKSNRSVPTWLNEGLAEFMSVSVLGNTVAAQRCKAAINTVSFDRRGAQWPRILGVFNEERWHTEADAFDYGTAQALVRFLIAADPKLFVRYVELLKAGKKGEEALQETYKVTYEELARRWVLSVSRP